MFFISPYVSFWHPLTKWQSFSIFHCRPASQPTNYHRLQFTSCLSCPSIINWPVQGFVFVICLPCRKWEYFHFVHDPWEWMGVCVCERDTRRASKKSVLEKVWSCLTQCLGKYVRKVERKAFQSYARCCEVKQEVGKN